MAQRSYRLGRRGEAAAETRRRIVEATAELHNEQGIANTSMKQIARRAGVSIGAVYHHFPTYEDAVSACGAYNFAAHPLPDPTIFQGVETRSARLELLTRRLFAIYRDIPALESAYADRHRIAALEAPLAQLDSGIESLLRAAVAPETLSKTARPAALALLHESFYRRLKEGGLDLNEAAKEAASLIAARLDGGRRPLKTPKGNQ